MTRPSLAGIERRAEVFRLHVPVSRCDTWEHGSSCPGVERCKNCRRRWPCVFITDAEAALIAASRTTVPALTAAVRDVLALAARLDRLAARHLDSETGRIETAVAHELRTTLAARLDLTDPEGDPT